MLKDLNRAILRVALVCCLPFALFYGCHAKRAFVDNPGHADAVFAPIFEEYDVLETRRWHRIGGEPWDCTYAIIGLPMDAPNAPPPAGTDATQWFLKWGGDWMPTPAAPLGDNTRDAIAACASYWSADVAGRVKRALAAPGSYSVVGAVGETVHIYSKPERLAARVRFGD